MILTNSKVKSFLQCEYAAYHQWIVGDYKPPVTDALSRGSLLDAIVTKAFSASASFPPDRAKLKEALASSYGDGSEHADNLLLKSGAFDAKAKVVITGGMRLLADPTVKTLLDGAEFQKRLIGKFADTAAEGTADIITKPINGKTYILDVKKIAADEEIWTTEYTASGSRSVKLPWWDAYDYWMQLTLYKSLLGNKDAVTGLLYVTEQDPAKIGLKLLATDESALEYIWRGVSGRISKMSSPGFSAFRKCGSCEYCRKTSTVQLNGDMRQPNIRYYFPGH